MAAYSGEAGENKPHERVKRTEPLLIDDGAAECEQPSCRCDDLADIAQGVHGCGGQTDVIRLGEMGAASSRDRQRAIV